MGRGRDAFKARNLRKQIPLGDTPPPLHPLSPDPERAPERDEDGLSEDNAPLLRRLGDPGGAEGPHSPAGAGPRGGGGWGRLSILFREKSPTLQGWPKAGGGQRQASGLALEASGGLQIAWARIWPES